jgi:hypothetical protein
MAAKAQINAQQTTRNGQLVTTTSNGHLKKMKNSTESNLEKVTAYQGNLRQATIWRDRNENTARVRALAVWRCKVCDEYFSNLKAARKHQHG